MIAKNNLQTCSRPDAFRQICGGSCLRHEKPQTAQCTVCAWSFYILRAGGTPAPQPEAVTASIVVQASSLQSADRTMHGLRYKCQVVTKTVRLAQ